MHALAESIVLRAHATSSIAAEIRALESWIGSHTRYSTDIPPLRPGQDAVDEFLFGNRTGYCEQISTALTVMLRTLGVPAREAIGYVPGPFDPFSDMYEIRASDAHAWVQAYIPQAGWQSFDPTAEVPLAPADPGAVLLSDIGNRLDHLPWPPIGGVVGAAAVGLGANAASRRRRLRPSRWEQRAALRLERLGHRSGVVRRPAETLAEYADRLAVSLHLRAGTGTDESDLVHRIAERISASAYGPSANDGAEAAVLADLRLLAPLPTAPLTTQLAPRASGRGAGAGEPGAREPGARGAELARRSAGRTRQRLFQGRTPSE